MLNIGGLTLRAAKAQAEAHFDLSHDEATSLSHDEASQLGDPIWIRIPSLGMNVNRIARAALLLDPDSSSRARLRIGDLTD